MEKILLALPALGCVVGMPLMMWLMMRGTRSQETPSRTDETAELRAQVEQLRQEISERDDVTN